MPRLKHLTVSLSEVIEVRGNPLEEPEIWSLLCQSAMKIQDLYISGKHFKSIPEGSCDLGLPIITPETLFVDKEGSVTFGCIKSLENRFNFVAPEINLLTSFGDAEIEKMLIYSLGKTLRFASLYHKDNHRFLQSSELPVKNVLSATLNETLNFMHQENCIFRHSLSSLFEYARIGSQLKSFSLILVSVFEELMGTSEELNLASASKTNGEPDIISDEELVTSEDNEASQNRSENTAVNAKDIPDAFIDEKNKNSRPTKVELSDDYVRLAECRCTQPSKGADDNEEEHRLFPQDKDQEQTSSIRGNSCGNSPVQQQKLVLGPEFVVKSRHAAISLSIVPSEHSSDDIKVVTVVSVTGHRFSVQVDAELSTNGDIFHAVAAHENIKERYLFGLAYMKGDEFIFMDLQTTLAKLMHKVGHQQNGFLNLEMLTLYLRVKFYVNHSTITDSSARRLQYLQLRKDILEERISCPLQSAILLASIALQVDFRNVNLEDCEEFRLEHYLPRWIIKRPDSESIRAELIQLHGSRDLFTSTETSRSDFAKHVQGLRDHGFHFHVVQRDKKDLKSTILLGVSLAGISIFAPLDTDQGENKQELQRYSWQQITRITHDKRHFYLTLQSRNLKNHFMKCRFHTRDHLGQYLFNLSFAHHRLHLRLISRLNESSIKSPPCLGSNGEDLLAQQSNPPIQTNVTKPRRSKTLRDLKILSSKRKPVLDAPANISNGQNSQMPTSNKASRKSSLLSTLFRKTSLNSHKMVQPQNGTQFYVIDTSISSRQNDSPVLKANEVISDSLDERFANLSGLERIERRISDVILLRDDKDSLGITVCEGADGATYVQSVAYVHYGSDIRPGDRIMAVNGRYVEAMSYECVVDLLKNSRTLVNLTVSQNLDQLDDDVFEQPDHVAASGASTTQVTNRNHVIPDDVTYECHDVDLRNEITSMCFVQEKRTDVHQEKFENADQAENDNSLQIRDEYSGDPKLAEVPCSTRTGTEPNFDATLSHQNVSHLERNSLKKMVAIPASSSLDRCDEIGRPPTLDGAAFNGLYQQTTDGRNEEILKNSSIQSETTHHLVDLVTEAACPTSSRTAASSSSRISDLPVNGTLIASTMVTKPNPAEENSVEFQSTQNNNGHDNTISSPVRTVLWNPRHSGTVRNKVCNFEEQSQKSANDVQQLMRHPSSSSSKNGLQQLSVQKNVPKSVSLHKFPSAEYDHDSDDRNKSRPIEGGAWCYAVTGRPYPNKRMPQLARSKTMPTVYRDHMASNSTSSDPPSSFKLPWLSQLKQGSALSRSARLILEAENSDVDMQAASHQPQPLPSPSANQVIFPPKSPSHIGKSSSDLPRPASRQHDFLREKPFVFDGFPSMKPRLSLSTDDVRRSSSFVAIAKEKLRKQSTQLEVPYILSRSSTADNVRLSIFKEKIEEESAAGSHHQLQRSKTNDPLLLKKLPLFFADVRIRQLQLWLPFVTESTTFEVSIQKNSRGLGLSVFGGKDQDPDDPFSQLIRIKRLYPLHPASETGLLKVGDLILVVNGRHLTGLNQSEVLDALRVATSSIDLVVCRPPPGALPPVPQTGGLFNSSSLSLSSMNLLGLAGDTIVETPSANPKEFQMTMEKWSGSLGFTMQRSEKPRPGHYVKALVKDPALTDGRLRAGDQILEVNGINISALSQSDAIGLLRSAPTSVILLVSRRDEPVLSPSSPLSPIFSLDHEDFRSRSDKKVLRKEALDLLSDRERRRSQESSCSTASVSPVSRRHLRKDRSPSNRTDSDAADTLSNASDLDSHVEIPIVKTGSHLKVPRPSFLGLNGSSRSGSSSPSTGATPSGIGQCFGVSASQSNSNTSPKINRRDANSISPQTKDNAHFPWTGTAFSPDSYCDNSDQLLRPQVQEQVWPISLIVELDRSLNDRLGFSLLGIEDGHLQGTYIRAIHQNTLADQDGRLKSGDKLVQVNGTAVKNLATNSVIEMLRKIRGIVILEVIRDPVVSSKVLATSHAIRSPSLVRKQVN